MRSYHATEHAPLPPSPEALVQSIEQYCARLQPLLDCVPVIIRPQPRGLEDIEEVLRVFYIELFVQVVMDHPLPRYPVVIDNSMTDPRRDFAEHSLDDAQHRHADKILIEDTRANQCRIKDPHLRPSRPLVDVVHPQAAESFQKR